MPVGLHFGEGPLDALAKDRMHGEDDQIVPFANSGPLSAKLLKNARTKFYPGFPHGMPATNADQINADILDFVSGLRAAAAPAA